MHNYEEYGVRNLDEKYADYMGILLINMIPIVSLILLMDSSHRSQSNKNTVDKDQEFSIVLALNKLKETEDRIYQAKHRLGWINNRNSKVEHKKMRSSHMSSFRSEIRDFAESQRRLKEENRRKKSQQTDRYHQINMEKRKQHQQKLKQLRETMYTQNKWVHDQIRKQKEQNQTSIKKQKSKTNEQKRKNRDVLFESEQRRLAYMKEFMKNKELTAKLRKAEETSNIKSRIMEREQLLANLERKGSELSCEANPEDNEPESIHKSSQVSGGNTDNRGFRVKVYKNQTSVIID